MNPHHPHTYIQQPTNERTLPRAALSPRGAIPGTASPSSSLGELHLLGDADLARRHAPRHLVVDLVIVHARAAGLLHHVPLSLCLHLPLRLLDGRL